MRNAIIPLLLALMSGLWVHGQSPPPDSLGERFWIAKVELVQPILMAAQGEIYGGVEFEKVVGKGRLNPVVGLSLNSLKRANGPLVVGAGTVGLRGYFPKVSFLPFGPAEGPFLQLDALATCGYQFEPPVAFGQTGPSAWGSIYFMPGVGFQKRVQRWCFAGSVHFPNNGEGYSNVIFSIKLGRSL